MRELVVGSRGSKLALTQTNWVIDQIKLHNPDLSVRVEIIKTQGDKILDVPLARIGDKGLFVKELELALMEGRVDLAVHSMKDLPTQSPDELDILAIPERVDPADVLLSTYESLEMLPQGAKIGSSSLRRRAQLLHFRPDLQIVDLRGNLDTRVNKLKNGEYDGIILAYAGLLRLGWAGEIAQRISLDVSLPAVGQGSLAIQGRRDDPFVSPLVAPLEHRKTRIAVLAERTLLRYLEGGCQIPIGAAAVVEDEKLRLAGMVASVDGKQLIRREDFGSVENPEGLGTKIAQTLLDSGAREILEEVRRNTGPTTMGAAG
jgi:hydroxymethylbilane synthase